MILEKWLWRLRIGNKVRVTTRSFEAGKGIRKAEAELYCNADLQLGLTNGCGCGLLYSVNVKEGELRVITL
jgi:hypothetical protein